MRYTPKNATVHLQPIGAPNIKRRKRKGEKSTAHQLADAWEAGQKPIERGPSKPSIIPGALNGAHPNDPCYTSDLTPEQRDTVKWANEKWPRMKCPIVQSVDQSVDRA